MAGDLRGTAEAFLSVYMGTVQGSQVTVQTLWEAVGPGSET